MQRLVALVVQPCTRQGWVHARRSLQGSSTSGKGTSSVSHGSNVCASCAGTGSVRGGTPSSSAATDAAATGSWPLWDSLRTRGLQGALREAWGEFVSDKGRILMNVGAISALTGFTMTDVLSLRLLNITGTVCGMAYNYTRSPPQWNAVAWGVVFGGVNLTMIYKLMAERAQIKFSMEEMDLWHNLHFDDNEVTPLQFKNLVDQGTWHKCNKGEVIVRAGRPLSSVVLIHRGQADAIAPDGKLLYTYKGGGTTSCIVGGTALVDPSVMAKPYPNRVVAVDDKVSWISWDTKVLEEIMHQDKATHSAIMQMLYGTLIWQLREDRKAERAAKETTTREDAKQALKHYELLLKGVTADDKVNAKEKELVQHFARDNNITNTQHLHLLQGMGWTPIEWSDGRKQPSKLAEEALTGKSALHREPREGDVSSS